MATANYERTGCPVPAGGEQAVLFEGVQPPCAWSKPVSSPESTPDYLATDDHFLAVQRQAEPVKVTLVSQGNLFLETLCRSCPGLDAGLAQPGESLDGLDSDLTSSTTTSDHHHPSPGNLLFIAPPRSTEYFTVTGPPGASTWTGGVRGRRNRPHPQPRNAARVNILDAVRIPLPEPPARSSSPAGAPNQVRLAHRKTSPSCSPRKRAGGGLRRWPSICTIPTCTPGRLPDLDRQSDPLAGAWPWRGYPGPGRPRRGAGPQFTPDRPGRGPRRQYHHRMARSPVWKPSKGKSSSLPLNKPANTGRLGYWSAGILRCQSVLTPGIGHEPALSLPIAGIETGQSTAWPSAPSGRLAPPRRPGSGPPGRRMAGLPPPHSGFYRQAPFTSIAEAHNIRNSLRLSNFARDFYEFFFHLSAIFMAPPYPAPAIVLGWLGRRAASGWRLWGGLALRAFLLVALVFALAGIQLRLHTES